MKSKKLTVLGREQVDRPVVDWLRETSTEGIDIFVYAEKTRAYGWLFERSGGVVRPFGMFHDICRGNIQNDLIPRLTVTEHSSRINSVAVFIGEESEWGSLGCISEQLKPRLVIPPKDIKELFFLRRQALDTGALVESGWKKFKQGKMPEKLDSIEIGFLRGDRPHGGNIIALRYLLGVCELLSRRQLNFDLPEAKSANGE